MTDDALLKVTTKCMEWHMLMSHNGGGMQCVVAEIDSSAFAAANSSFERDLAALTVYNLA